MGKTRQKTTKRADERHIETIRAEILPRACESHGLIRKEGDVIHRPRFYKPERLPNGALRIEFLPADGKTVSDYQRKSDGLASALQAYKVRIVDDGAGRGHMIVLDSSPWADRILWDVDEERLNKPMEIFTSDLGERLSLPLIERNVLIAGAPGSGKSGVEWAIVAEAAARPNVLAVGIDPKGTELGPFWPNTFAAIAETKRETTKLYDSCESAMEWRNQKLKGMKGRKIERLTPEMPAIWIIDDEFTETARRAPGARESAEFIAQKGRSTGFQLFLAIQVPTKKVMESLRDMISIRWIGHAGSPEHAAMVLGDGAPVDPQRLPLGQGVGYLYGDGFPGYPLVKTDYIDDKDAPYIDAIGGVTMPELPPSIADFASAGTANPVVLPEADLLAEVFGPQEVPVLKAQTELAELAGWQDRVVGDIQDLNDAAVAALEAGADSDRIGDLVVTLHEWFND